MGKVVKLGLAFGWSHHLPEESMERTEGAVSSSCELPSMLREFVMIHSLRNASTGLSRAARQAGNNPAKVETIMEDTTMMVISLKVV